VIVDDGAEVWVETTGSGPGLVLCHGGPGLWDMFGGLAGRLADLRTVHRWDQRGCGRSQRRGPYTLERFDRDLDAVVRWAGAPVALLGHSWGAQLGLWYALHHPANVTHLVYLSGTGLSLHSWRPAFQAAFVRRLGRRAAELRELDATDPRAGAMLRWRADVYDPDRADGVATEMADPWFDINWDANRGIGADAERHWDEAALTAACRALRVPTLILEGAEDPRPRWAVDSLADALPDVRRVSLPGVGHLPWLEAPETVLTHLRAFLS
jgi:proline iminopeptidase